MAQLGLKELLEAGVHFGHQTRRWNPKMRRFIFGERDGIYIIDLVQTEEMLDEAQRFASSVARRGGTVLFVGTKKQARDAIQETAEAADMPYVNHRWLGGLLTNFQTISQRIKRLHDLERYETEGQLGLLPTRERMSAQSDLEKLRANLGGVKHMERVPDAVFVIDLKTEAIAVREAQRLRIPIIGLVDTNCDPDGIDYVIPGNDDAIRSCAAITRAIGDVVAQGHGVFRAEEEAARLERERREAEERARREAEEQARLEAEAAAAAAADASAESVAAPSEGAVSSEAPTPATEAAVPPAGDQGASDVTAPSEVVRPVEEAAVAAAPEGAEAPEPAPQPEPEPESASTASRPEPEEESESGEAAGRAEGEAEPEAAAEAVAEAAPEPETAAEPVAEAAPEPGTSAGPEPEAEAPAEPEAQAAGEPEEAPKRSRRRRRG